MWFFYAILGAVFKAATSFIRKNISGKIDGDVYLWVNLSIVTLLLLPAVLFSETNMQRMLSEYWLPLLGVAATTTGSTILTIAALKREELSYITPLNAFIPIFTLVIAWLFLNESPPIGGIIGIFAVFLGVYIMNTNPSRSGWMAPLKHLLSNSGARFGFAAAFMFATNPAFSKSVLNGGYGIFEVIFMSSLIGLLLNIHVPLRKSPKLVAAFKNQWPLILLASLTSLSGVVLFLLSINDTFTSYAISVRRFDIIFTVLLGWRVLKETNIRNKLIGSALMTVGVAVIALF